MKDLDEAWRWYENTTQSLKLIRRLGDRYWKDFPWEGPLGRDEHLQSYEGPTVVETADHSLRQLDDLAVMVLFSVFESVVRERVLSGIKRERLRISHQHVRAIVDRALDGIENGSFFRILDVYKIGDADLVEEVNQVRKYRNWVAHGRRSRQPASVTPDAAFGQLKRFLAVLDRLEPDES